MDNRDLIGKTLHVSWMNEADYVEELGKIDSITPFNKNSYTISYTYNGDVKQIKIYTVGLEQLKEGKVVPDNYKCYLIPELCRDGCEDMMKMDVANSLRGLHLWDIDGDVEILGTIETITGLDDEWEITDTDYNTYGTFTTKEILALARGEVVHNESMDTNYFFIVEKFITNIKRTYQSCYGKTLDAQ